MKKLLTILLFCSGFLYAEHTNINLLNTETSETLKQTTEENKEEKTDADELKKSEK